MTSGLTSWPRSEPFDLAGRQGVFLAVGLLALNAGACTKPNPEYCEDPSRPCPEGACINHRCVLLDAPIDGAPDAIPDAALQAAFDLGFVTQWRIGTGNTAMTEFNWARIVNMGVSPLDLSTASITAVVDDHPAIVVDVTWLGATTIVSPGFSAGALTPPAAQMIVTSGLVTEPAQETTMGNLRLSVTNIPGTWIGVNAEVTLQIANARVTLPILVVASGGGTTVTPYMAARATSSPAP